MGKRRNTVRLSAGEMDLMNVLWQEGPVTIAEAHRAFGKSGRAIGYPTMQTRLNRLVAKGLATRSGRRPARYEPAVTVDQVTAGHLDQLLDKLAGATVAPLVCHLISERPLTEREIRQLRELLDQAQRSAKRPSTRGSVTRNCPEGATSSGRGPGRSVGA